MGINLGWELLNYKFLNNEIGSYLLFVLLFLAIILTVWIFKRLTLAKYSRKNQKAIIDDLLIKTIIRKAMIFIYLIAFQLCLQTLTFVPQVNKSINIIMAIVLTATGTNFIQVLVIGLLSRYWSKKQGEPAANHTYHVLLTILKIIIWVISAVILLQNLPVNITPLLTGLGIGGIAVAFAAQAILQDLFSFVTIFFDRPFEIGDFIIVDEFMGTVDKIGMKTTRLCSLSGEQLVLSNRDLTSSRVRNYKRMNQRRVAFNLNVVYETNLSVLQEIPEMMKEIILTAGNTIFDRAHLANIGTSSFVYEVVYYVTTSNYTVYMNVQQEINFKIIQAFNNKGIKFAYPTQVHYVETMTHQ